MVRFSCEGAEYGVCEGEPVHDEACPDSLRDARPLGVVRLTHKDGISSIVGPSCVVPDPSPLYAILSDVVDHTARFPTHGASCICMDDFIREIRAHINRALEERRRDGESKGSAHQFQDEFMASSRIGYVVRTALKGA